MIDLGHDLLIADLTKLLRDAEAFHFHDRQSPHATPPKLELTQRLRELTRHAQAGRYDNRDED